MRKAVLIINYHQIYSGSDTGMSEIGSVFSVRDSSFENQIKLLTENKIPVISLRDLTDNTISSDFSVAITIDDGHSSDYELVYPILSSNNLTATFFLLVNNTKSRILSWDQAQEMADHGFSIGSHGVSHRDLTCLSLSELQNELEFSKKYIEDKINKSVDYFSFPCGIYNKEVIEYGRKAGYKGMLTTDCNLNYPDNSPFLIYRWSIKRTTTLKEFEGMINNSKLVMRKIISSKINKVAKQILGKSITDKLSILIHTQGISK